MENIPIGYNNEGDWTGDTTPVATYPSENLTEEEEKVVEEVEETLTD